MQYEREGLGVALIINILWAIWKEGMNSMFQNKKSNPIFTPNKATSLTNELFQAQENLTNLQMQLPQINTKHPWRPPPETKLKSNVDSAFCEKKKIGSVAAIIGGRAQKLPVFPSRLAEAIAIREGLILAQNSHCEAIIVEMELMCGKLLP